MAKYNITGKSDKEPDYHHRINPILIDELKNGIITILINQNKYKDKTYSAKQLAEDLKTNTRYISAAINLRFHKNYTSFVNELRIEEAMNMLADKRYIDLDMEDVSDAVGFSNRQSFYAAFLKENGCTPREYRITHSNMYHNGKKIVKPKKKKTKSAKTKND